MDTEKFISLVKSNPSLWDHRDPNYHVRNIQRYYWNEISKQMGDTIDELKRKWRGLRDTFRKEYKKTIIGNSGDITWPHFYQLEFLTDTINTKKSYVHSKADIEIEEANDLPSANLLLEFNDDNDYISTIPRTDYLYENTSEHNYSSKKKVSSLEPLVKRSKHEKSRREKAEERKAEGDSDYQFLLSLLPYLNEIPKCRKLAVRTKMQQILIDEQDLRSDSFG